MRLADASASVPASPRATPGLRLPTHLAVADRPRADPEAHPVRLRTRLESSQPSMRRGAPGRWSLRVRQTRRPPLPRPHSHAALSRASSPGRPLPGPHLPRPHSQAALSRAPSHGRPLTAARSRACTHPIPHAPARPRTPQTALARPRRPFPDRPHPDPRAPPGTADVPGTRAGASPTAPRRPRHPARSRRGIPGPRDRTQRRPVGPTIASPRTQERS